MRLCIKKIYCSTCRRPVAAVEPPGDPPYRILCSKCGMTICVSNGIYWRRGVPGEAAPAREPSSAPATTVSATAPPRKPTAPRRPAPARPAAAREVRAGDRSARPAAAGEIRAADRPKAPAGGAKAGEKPARPAAGEARAADKPKAAAGEAKPHDRVKPAERSQEKARPAAPPQKPASPPPAA